MAASKGGHDDGIGGNIRLIKSRKGEALSEDRNGLKRPPFCDPGSRSLGNPLLALIVRFLEAGTHRKSSIASFAKSKHKSGLTIRSIISYIQPSLQHHRQQ